MRGVRVIQTTRERVSIQPPMSLTHKSHRSCASAVVAILLSYRAKRRILPQSHAHSRAHTNTCACSVVFLMSSNCPHPHPRPNGLRMRVNSRSPNQIHSRSIRGNGGRAWSDGQILGKWARQSIMGGLHSTFNAPSETSGSLRPLASFGGQDAGPNGEQTGQPTRMGCTHAHLRFGQSLG